MTMQVAAIPLGRCHLLRHWLQDPLSLGMHDRRHWRIQRRGNAHGATTGESDAAPAIGRQAHWLSGDWRRCW